MLGTSGQRGKEYNTKTIKGENMETNYQSDIPRQTAIWAFSGTSWTPEDRADTVIREYSETLNADYATLAEYANTDDKREQLDNEFARYREGYRKHYTAWLNSRAHCMSAAITGPANFPTSRNQKRFEIEMRRSQECSDYRKRALDAIEKVLRPELRPVMSGDGDAVERLQDKLEKAEKLQEEMRTVNKLIKKKSGPDREALHALGYSDKIIDELIKPDYCGRVGYADYQLTNNNANIRRMRERLEHLKKVKSMPDVERTENGITVTDCPNENRIRIAFPGKPDESIRSELKHNGFRWTPSLGVWQAYRNNNAMITAKKMLAVSHD